jgi:hypothetical protein
MNLAINNQDIAINSPIVAENGRITPFKTWADAQGYDVTDKKDRKSAMVEYDGLKSVAMKQLRAVAAAAVADSSFEVRKAKPVLKDGQLVGVDISTRMQSKKAAKAVKGNPLRVAAENLASHLGVSVDRAMEILAGQK